MHRRLTAAIALTAALAALAAPALSQPEGEPKVTVSELPATLHLLQGKGGNVVASVGEDGVLIIDDDYTDYGPAYAEVLSELAGDSDSTPRFVVNTHWHFDHTGGNRYWGERGSVIVAHANVYQRMSTPQQMSIGRKIDPSPEAALPVVTYGDSVALRFNGGAVELQHHPRGHTDGDSVVYFVEQNVVHMGDHYFKDRFPFIDLGSGGSVAGYIKNVKAVLERIDSDTVVVPGHGNLASKADLERYSSMLDATTSKIISRLEDGASVDDIVTQGLGQRWESWGAGFIDEATWIRTVAKSVGE